MHVVDSAIVGVVLGKSTDLKLGDSQMMKIVGGCAGGSGKGGRPRREFRTHGGQRTC